MARPPEHRPFSRRVQVRGVSSEELNEAHTGGWRGSRRQLVRRESTPSGGGAARVNPALAVFFSLVVRGYAYAGVRPWTASLIDKGVPSPLLTVQVNQGSGPST